MALVLFSLPVLIFLKANEIQYFFSLLFLDAPLKWQESYNYLVIKNLNSLNYAYPPKSLENTFFIYTPFLYWMSYPLYKVLEFFNLESIRAMRLAVNLPALFVLTSSFFTLINKEQGVLRALIVTVYFILFITCLDSLVPWLMLLRQDLLIVSVLMLCFYGLSIKKESRTYYISLGFLFAIPFALKQSFLLIVFFLPLLGVLRNKKYFISFLVTCSLMLFSVLVPYLIYGENYLQWVWIIPSKQEVRAFSQDYLNFLLGNFSVLFILFISTSLYLIYKCRGSIKDLIQRDEAWLVSFSSVLFIISVLSALKTGGSVGGFVIGILFIAIFVFISISKNQVSLLFIPVIIMGINSKPSTQKIRSYEREYKQYDQIMQKVDSLGTFYSTSNSQINKDGGNLNEVVLKYEIVNGIVSNKIKLNLSSLEKSLSEFDFIALSSWSNNNKRRLKRVWHGVNLLQAPAGFVKVFEYRVEDTPDVLDLGIAGSFFPIEVWASDIKRANKLKASLTALEKEVLIVF